MTQQDYLIAWALYVASCSGLIWIGWSWTRKIRPAVLRRCIRVIAILALLTPYQSYPDMDFLAPALIILVFESVLEGSQAALRVGVPLATSLGAGTLIAILYSIIFRQPNKKDRKDRQQDKAG